MPLSDDESLADFLDRLADVAAKAIMPHFRASTEVTNKAAAHFDPVTAADRDAEAEMRKLIAATYPDHGVVGEEYGPERPDARFVWVLDPIDGTRSFITGLPVWGTLIGLLEEGRPRLGMMAQPFTGERFAGDGSRAWYTGPDGAKPLATRPMPSIGDAALFTTSPYLFSAAEGEAYRRIERTVRLARYGCDCYAYCMVAAGQADIVIEAGLQAYDIVALIPILEGAGGRLTGWDGGSAAAGGRVCATGDPRLHDLILAELETA
jgi:histidinol phosphatase-like enzyme (inositol monophosphatase family)